jgi:hypothetical protein
MSGTAYWVINRDGSLETLSSYYYSGSLPSIKPVFIDDPFEYTLTTLELVNEWVYNHYWTSRPRLRVQCPLLPDITKPVEVTSIGFPVKVDDNGFARYWDYGLNYGKMDLLDALARNLEVKVKILPGGGFLYTEGVGSYEIERRKVNSKLNGKEFTFMEYTG